MCRDQTSPAGTSHAAGTLMRLALHGDISHRNKHPSTACSTSAARDPAAMPHDAALRTEGCAVGLDHNRGIGIPPRLLHQALVLKPV